jgi:hypothetical protein
MEAFINSPVSHQQLTSLAIKLREDLIDYEDKFGSSRDFAELMNSAGALVMAIIEPKEFRLSASLTKKALTGSSTAAFSSQITR